MTDSLGDRMKEFEKQETGRKAMPGLPILIRIDGRGFSKWTRGLERPFDARLQDLRVLTTTFLVQELRACFGFCQSDEISLGLWAEDPIKTQLFSGGKFQKLVSLSASMATAFFNREVPQILPEKASGPPAMFDSRVWCLPSLEEAANAILWRERDATKNSVSQATRAFFGPSQMMGKSSSEMQEMLFSKGVNWNDFPDWAKRGTAVMRTKETRALTEADLEGLPPQAQRRVGEVFTRSRTEAVSLPPMGRISNLVDVIFKGAEPVLFSKV